MFWPFARPDHQHRPIVEPLSGAPRLARIVTVCDSVRVDPRSALAALGDGTHDHHLGSLEIARSNPRSLERQRDETVGSSLRASRHDRLMMSPPADARICLRHSLQSRRPPVPNTSVRSWRVSGRAGTRCARGRRRRRRCRGVATQCTCRRRAALAWRHAKCRRTWRLHTARLQRQIGVGSMGSCRRITT